MPRRTKDQREADEFYEKVRKIREQYGSPDQYRQKKGVEIPDAVLEQYADAHKEAALSMPFEEAVQDARDASQDTALASPAKVEPKPPTRLDQVEERIRARATRYHVAWIRSMTWVSTYGTPYTQTTVEVDTLHDYAWVVEKINIPPGPGGRYVVLECGRAHCTAPEKTHKDAWGII